MDTQDFQQHAKAHGLSSTALAAVVYLNQCAQQYPNPDAKPLWFEVPPISHTGGLAVSRAMDELVTRRFIELGANRTAVHIMAKGERVSVVLHGAPSDTFPQPADVWRKAVCRTGCTYKIEYVFNGVKSSDWLSCSRPIAGINDLRTVKQAVANAAAGAELKGIKRCPSSDLPTGTLSLQVSL